MESPSIQHLCQPSRNYSALKAVALTGVSRTGVMNDPRDGREKYVLVNSPCGKGRASLIFIDIDHAGDPGAAHHEAHELPGDESAWGLCNLDNEVLVVSTSPLCLYFVFDLRTRTWV
ncbi:MAG: hypothetical protein ABIL09_02810, partial [Gemmatimonadota bacterium]